MQQIGQGRLGAAGVVAQGVDQVDFRRAHALFPQGAEDEFFGLARNFCDFSFGNVHRRLPGFRKMYLHRCTCNHYSPVLLLVNRVAHKVWIWYT